MPNNLTVRETVLLFFECVARADIDGLAALLHEDLVWWTSGAELFAFSGSRSKPETVEIFRGITANFPDGLVLKIKNEILDGDRIAFEAEGTAVTANGLTYNNIYHIQMRLQDGRIISVREHMDTLYANAVLIENRDVPPAY